MLSMPPLIITTISSLKSGLSAFVLALCVHFNEENTENSTYSRDSLRQLLVKRIGIETFTSKIGEVSKHELYNKAAKHPQLRAAEPSEVLIDYEFCRLFKGLEGECSSSFLFFLILFLIWSVCVVLFF